MWSWEEVWGDAGGHADDLFRAFRSFSEGAGRAGFRTLASPVDPFNRSSLTPLVAVAGVVGVVMLSGVAIGAALVAAAALVALYFLLHHIFGFEVSIDVPAWAGPAR
jgi:hypothetical protein